MNKLNHIFNTLIDNGISFWDSDIEARSVVVEGDLTIKLGISATLSYDSILQYIPKTFKDEIFYRISSSLDGVFPMQVDNTLHWIEVHRLHVLTDDKGHQHQVGTVRLMDDDEVGGLILSDGINLRTCEPMSSAFDMMNRPEQFAEGVRLILHTLCKQIGMDEAGALKWNLGSHYEVANYMNADGLSYSNEGKKVNSKLCQYACQTRKIILFDSNNPLDDKWEQERMSILKYKVRSMLIIPLVIGDKRPIGALVIIGKLRRTLTAFDVQWANMIAGRIAIVADGKMMNDKQNEQLRLMGQACEAGKVITWVVNCKSEKGEISVYQNGEQLNTEFTIPMVTDIIHKSDVARFNKATQIAMLGETDTITVRLRLRGFSDGLMGWRELRSVVMRDKKGVPERIVGISRDISEEVERANELKLEHDFQNTIYNNVPAGIEFFNENGELIFINDTAMELFGVEGGKRSIIGLNIFENPNLTEQQRTEIKYGKTVQYVISYDFRKVVYKTHRTDIIEMNYRMSKLYKRNKFVGYIVALGDNSELVRQAKQISIFQRYFLEIGKFAKMGMCWFSDTKNGYVSEQWNINLGVKPDAPYMRNLSLLVRVYDEDLEVYGSLLGRIFVGDIDSFQYELRVTHEDNMLHYIKVQFVRSEEAVIGLSIDVTQSKENEKMLIEAKFKAETADMLKSQFLDNMNHEIRTPLNAIVGFSDIIAQSVNSEDLKLYAQLIRSNNDILLNTIGDIIDLSKITSGTMEYNYKETDVNALVNDVYEEYNQMSHSKIEFVCTCAEKNVKAYCDAQQLKRILSNFVSNSFKFTATGRVELYFGVNGNELEFNIIDTGCGIPVDKIDKIFEPYCKLDIFSVGTGLGLPICKSLAHDMGGRIEVFSTEGVGSHFRLHLPYQKTPNKSNDILTENNDIMLLSSNNEIIQFVSYALSNYNLLLEQEHIFMSLWLEKRPTLTIIDQQLFGDSIAVVVSSLHNYGGNHKVVVLANEGIAIDHDAIIRAGAENIISLPISSDKFKTIIASHMSKQPNPTQQQ